MFIDQDFCDVCGLCRTGCPFGVIKLVGGNLTTNHTNHTKRGDGCLA